MLTTRNVPTGQRGVGIAFAALGGVIGGAMSDLLEPAISPNHRAEFHSVVMGAGVGAAAMLEWQARCRERAVACDGRAALWPIGSQDRSHEETLAFLWRALASLLVGCLAGYASHLALDAMTARPDESLLKTGYDFVTCSEVVEHVHDPHALLKRFEHLLARRGTLGIMTSLYHERTPFGEWWYRRDPTHVCFYHENTMRWIAHKFRWAVALPAPNIAIFTMGADHGVA